MFFNSPFDSVVIGSAFFSGVGVLVFGTAAYYGIKAAIIQFINSREANRPMATRNK